MNRNHRPAQYAPDIRLANVETPGAPSGGDIDRRRFLELMAASLALGGGCSVSQPTEEIVPQVRAPEYAAPGKPSFYATALTLGGYAAGVLVESHMGRPTRIDGNPDHPASLGGIDAVSQAAILSLYDPHRSQAILARGEIRTWSNFLSRLQTALAAQMAQQGAGMRILTETVASPTLAGQLEQVLQRFPQARWHQYEPVNRDNVLAGAQLALGKPVEARYRFDRADVVVSLDCDFLTFGPGHVRYARVFPARRRLPPAHPSAGPPPLNRLYVAETAYSPTGAVADHRLPLSPQRLIAAAHYLAAAVGAPSTADLDADAQLDDAAKSWLHAAADDLQQHTGLVVAGCWQPPLVHALVHAINNTLGVVGETVQYTEPVAARPVGQVQSLRDLAADMRRGNVELLLIAGGNPAFNAPADVPFADALANVELSVHLGEYEDETSRHCEWHVPAAHALESWTDARAFDGTATIVQPLIEPLYDGKTVHQLLAAMLGQPEQTSQQAVREYWRSRRSDLSDVEFQQFWRKSLHDGVVAGTRFEPIDAPLSDRESAGESGPSPSSSGGAGQPFEIAFRPDPTLYDGRFANNSWLQELPKPLTKLTWDNAALISPQTAQALQVDNEQLIELRHNDLVLSLPVWMMPGHADDSITLHFGGGRTAAGPVGSGAGFDVFRLRRADAFWSAADISVQPLAQRYPLACTQQHHRMEGRHLVRTATWSEFVDHPEFAAAHSHGATQSLYDQSPHRDDSPDSDYAWGMSINLNACTGCNACVLACQAENNIPTVGKDEVRRGREMHWIRIDHYLQDAHDGPRALQQPVTCMHCENAPCEVVCPVAATVHSAEGLNEMVYNRCVGTRYCSNNCPYKVRRFNFLHYADDDAPVLNLLRNPDVTVRSRGVMEKCTYCVQRISAARIEAKKENRKIRDGEVVTACQAVCPTQAIQFGDIANADSRVAQLKAHPLDYGLLTELNTRPRTTYLARVTNPNPKLD